jgi:glycine cleavage system H protein
VIKENLRYTKEHEWLSIDGQEATVGVTDFAQNELGDIVFVELPAKGTKVMAGAPFGTIEAVKTVAELYAPVTGEIVAVNQKLIEDAALVNTDCYGAGWMIKIRMSDPKDVDQLLSAADYGEMIASH